MCVQSLSRGTSSGSVARLQKHGQQLACWASTEISEKMLLAYRQSAPCQVPRFRVALLAQGFSGRNTSERLFRTCNPSLDNLLSVQVCRGTISRVNVGLEGGAHEHANHVEGTGGLGVSSQMPGAFGAQTTRFRFADFFK